MLRSLFIVFDDVAVEMTGPIFCLPNEAAARRVFADALTGDGSQLASHPEDYSLVSIGEIDTETGQIESSLPRQVVSGADVMRKLAERERPQVDPAEGIEAGVLAAGDELLARQRRQVS